MKKQKVSLAIYKPHLIPQWHPTKNEGLTPSDVSFGSAKKVWWQCEKGHEWQTSVNSRTSRERGCPYCSGKKVLVGFNDLATQFPAIAKEWHPTKNGITTPQDVTGKSGLEFWWQCEHGHEWISTVCNRTINEQGCPYCAGRVPIKGLTDLETVFPQLAKEWHPIKNRSQKPSDFTIKSNKKVWWQCEKGHEWSSIVANRTKGTGCPECRSHH